MLSVACDSIVPLDAAVPDADTDTDANLCRPKDRWPLVVDRFEGVASAAYLPVTKAGRRGLMHVDTASAFSLLLITDAGWVDHAGSVSLNCAPWALPGFGAPALPRVQGLEVIGSLGADIFQSQSMVFDVAHNEVRLGSSALDGGVSANIELVGGNIVVLATFDGVPVRLLLDTGSSDSLWLGAPAEPGDEEVVTTDYLGRELRLYRGSVALGLGRGPRTVPVFHAPSFPLLEDLQLQLGTHLDGLLGLSSFSALGFSKFEVGHGELIVLE